MRQNKPELERPDDAVCCQLVGLFRVWGSTVSAAVKLYVSQNVLFLKLLSKYGASQVPAWC